VLLISFWYLYKHFFILNHKFSIPGAKCSVEIPKAEEKLTIGQKLLKEPIWIGMIVILNLVLFFCVSYVIRRKCGKKIANLFPKKKTSNSSPKGKSILKKHRKSVVDLSRLLRLILN
jgi:hypothetical protein